MNIINYKHLKKINFSLNNSTTIFSNDILINQDLMELVELIIKGKNPDPTSIKLEECDLIVVNKNFKIIKIPPLFDLRKNVLSGSKSLIAMLVKEIILTNKYRNENLNLIQNLLQHFNIIEEIEQLKILQTDIAKLTELRLELELTAVIENYISENIVASIFNSENELVKEENINLYKMRSIYFKILEFFGMYLENDVFFLFENPFLGLNYREIEIIKKIIANIPNKFCITNVPLMIEIGELDSFSLLLSRISINVPLILNNWHDYQFHLTKEYNSRNFVVNFLNKMIFWVNLYDGEWIKYQDLIEDEYLFWEKIKNSLFS